MSNSIILQTNGTVAACVHELVGQQAVRSPVARAVSAADGTLTYGELEARSSRVGEFLLQKGVVRGDLVGICMNRTTDLVVVLLGVLKVGAAYVPLDPALPSERLAYMAADAQLKCILTAKMVLEGGLPSNVPRVYVDDIDFTSHHIENAILPRGSVEDLAYVLYTSGSTGKPKGVEISHGALTNFLCSMRVEPGCRATDVLLSVTTVSFDIAGLELYLPLIVGGCVELASFDVAADGRLLSERIEQCQPTLMQATPATWRMLIYAGWRGAKGLVALCGGETLSRKLADDLLDRTKALWNMYGPTETTIWSTLAKIETGGGVISIGKPIANTQVYVLDQSMRQVPVGVTGELYIGGDGVARGYRNSPELTAEKFVPDPFSVRPGVRLFRSGDIVHSLPDGSLVHLGRLDSQVQIHGFRIELQEIQMALARHPDIEQVVISTFDDSQGIKELAAYIVSVGGVVHDAESLRIFLRSTLPDYMVPSYFVYLKAFPLTANNKIDMKALPAPSSETAMHNNLRRKPRSRLDTQILAIWRQTLEVDELGIDDSFFDVGGNSLRAVQLLAGVEEILGHRLPLDILFQVPTVAQMVDRISSGALKPVQGSLVVIRRRGRKVPFFAIPGAGGNVLMFAQLARLLGPDQPFYGIQARGVDNYEKPLESVTEMASQYVAEIRSIQREGPYFIAGSCTGGVIAYEMAQQFYSQREQVTLVILDSEHPSANQSYLQFGSSLWRARKFWSRGVVYLQSLWHSPLRTWPTLLYAKLTNAANGLRARNAVSPVKTDLQLGAIYQKNMAAIARYQVRKYPGMLLNVVASARRFESGVADTRRCWISLASAGSRNESIAAEDSGQLFVSPHVERLAQLLGAMSEELQQSHNKSDG